MLSIASIGCVTAAALSALSLGLDVGMISSTLVQPTFHSYLNNPSSSAIGGIVAAFSAGAVFGSFGCALIADRYGRVMGLLVGAIIVIIGCALQAGAVNVAMLIVGRLINGFGAGQLTAVFPVYASEIAPPAIRGALGMLQMLGIELAIFLATATGYGFGTHYTTTVQWRGPLAIQAIPPVILVGVCFFLPETPRWLIAHGKPDKARSILRRLHEQGNGMDFVEKEFNEITEKLEAEKHEIKPTWRELITRKSYRKRIVLCALLQTFGQLTGINCIQYYAATIYEKLGFSTYDALKINLIYGAFGFLYGLFWMPLIDRVGRKPVLIICSLMMGAAVLVQSVLSAVYANKDTINNNALNAQVAMFFVFSLFFVGPGGIAWLMPPEMLPMVIRAKGTSVSVSVNNLAGLVVAQVSPIGLEHIGFKFFYVFVACDIVAAVVYWRFFPETSKLTLEEMDIKFGDQPTLDHLHVATGHQAELQDKQMPFKGEVDETEIVK